MSAPSGYGGERGLALLGPGRVLFSSGRIGTGAGDEIGPPDSTRFLTMVRRSDAVWTACGLEGVDHGYFAQGVGALFCQTFGADGAVLSHRVLGDARFHAPVDLVVGPEVTQILARESQGPLTAFRFQGRESATGWRLPESETARTAFFVDADHVAVVHDEPAGCLLRTYRLAEGPPVQVSETAIAPAICDMHEFQVVRDVAGPGVWLYAWTFRQAELYDLASGAPAPVEAVQLGPLLSAPLTIVAVDGVLYFDAGNSRERVSQIGAYDPRSRRQTTHAAQGGPGLEGPPALVGLTPSFDGSLSVLVRNGAWAVNPF